MNLSAKQIHRCGKQIYGYWGIKGRGKGQLGDWG